MASFRIMQYRTALHYTAPHCTVLRAQLNPDGEPRPGGPAGRPSLWNGQVHRVRAGPRRGSAVSVVGSRPVLG